MPSKKLTDKLLKGLKPPKTGQIDVWDKIMPGFGIRVSMGGRKSFIVGTRINGKFRRITLKPAYEFALTVWSASLSRKHERRRSRSSPTPRPVWSRAEEETRGGGHIRSCRRCLHAGLCEEPSHAGEMQRKINVDLADWHDRPIAEIKRADIKELIRLKARTAPISANRLAALISKIFAWALKEEMIEASPAMQIDRPGKETERERALSADEIRTVWGAFDGSVIRSAHCLSCCSSPGSGAVKWPV